MCIPVMLSVCASVITLKCWLVTRPLLLAKLPLDHKQTLPPRTELPDNPQGKPPGQISWVKRNAPFRVNLQGQMPPGVTPVRQKTLASPCTKALPAAKCPEKSAYWY